MIYYNCWRNDVIARGPVWIEAYEEYLISRKLATRDMTTKLIDDELADYYYKVVKEKIWKMMLINLFINGVSHINN